MTAKATPFTWDEIKVWAAIQRQCGRESSIRAFFAGGLPHLARNAFGECDDDHQQRVNKALRGLQRKQLHGEDGSRGHGLITYFHSFTTGAVSVVVDSHSGNREVGA